MRRRSNDEEPAEPDFGEHLFELRHRHSSHRHEELSDRMALSTLQAMLGDHDGDFEASDRVLVSETGGPFVVTEPEDEYAYGSDGIPIDTEAAPWPTVAGDPPPSPDELD